jgi:hypothetical protein
MSENELAGFPRWLQATPIHHGPALFENGRSVGVQTNPLPDDRSVARGAGHRATLISQARARAKLLRRHAPLIVASAAMSIALPDASIGRVRQRLVDRQEPSQVETSLQWLYRGPWPRRRPGRGHLPGRERTTDLRPGDRHCRCDRQQQQVKNCYAVRPPVATSSNNCTTK